MDTYTNATEEINMQLEYTGKGEYTILEVIEQYGLDTSDSTADSLRDDVLAYLYTETMVIELDNGNVIVQDY